MSGADISEIVRRALEAKVHRVAPDDETARVTTADVLEAIEAYRRVRGIVEKIRYGQYL
jgi:SpoVK/Ycf46/Vps4 family AAA+-type ATPase